LSANRELATTLKITLKFILNPMTNFEIIKTERGNQKLVCNGFLYIKRNLKNKKEMWYCEKRNCKGSLQVENEMPFVQQQHNHPADLNGCNAKLVLNKIYQRALDTSEKSKDIINSFLISLEDEICT
jgi:hypothetical protein